MKRNVLFYAAFAVAVPSVFAQGGLTPPGAPAPSMKTLEQVEPRIDLATVSGDASCEAYIYTSGSYYLSANLEVTKFWGILIDTEDVVLDLNGFKIVRVSGSGGHGISLGSFANRVAVRNGSIRGFDHGIWSSSESCRFEKLALSGCSLNGIFAGTASRIVDCQAYDNAGAGIFTGNGSVLTGCIAYQNTGVGIYAGSGSSLSGCTAHNNAGTHGIHVYEKAILENCSANGNDGVGIETGDGSVLRNCSVGGNQGSCGIKAGSGSFLSGCCACTNHCFEAIASGNGSSLEGCIANNNRTGAVSSSYAIAVGSGSTLRNCSACGNIGASPASCGIHAGIGSMILGCTASDNENTHTTGSPSEGAGIYVWYSGSVKDCAVAGNQGAGIRMARYCEASGNTAYGNGVGIHAAYDGNRIDGNNVVSNSTYGIVVANTGNIIVRNVARDNGVNYDIVAGNDAGTMQTSPVGAGPWDNFDF